MTATALVFAGAFTALLAHAQDLPPSQAGKRLVLTYQARLDASAETIATLATLVETKKVTVAKTTSVRDLLRKEYRSSIDQIRDVFAEYNGDSQIITRNG